MLKKVSLLSLAAVFAAQLAGCGSFSSVSTWKDKGREITIDGNDAEWRGKTVQYGALFLGACNDADALYLCITSTDKDTLSQLTGSAGQTLTLWFDPAGKEHRALALRFSRAVMPPRGNGQPRGGAGQPGTAGGPDALPAKGQAKTPDGTNGALTVEVLENGKVVAALAETKGIEAAIATVRSGREVVCEVKIPLKADDTIRYALQASPGTMIGAGIEASEVTTRQVPSRGKGGPGEGGENGPGAPPDDGMNMGGGGGMPPMGAGGPGGPGMSGGSETAASPVKLSGRILLAAE